MQAALNEFQNQSNQSGLEAELAQAKKNWAEAQTRAYNNKVLLDKEQQKAQTLFKKQQGFKRALIGVSIAAIASLGILAATHLFGWKKDKKDSYEAGKNSVDITIDNQDAYDQGYNDGKSAEIPVLELPDFPRLEGESDADYLNRWRESDNQGAYDKGYKEGQDSVDITTDNQDAYDKGYKEGQDSVDITVDNKDAYDKGYSDGQNSGNNYSTNGTGAAVEQGEGSVTPVSAGDDENTNTGEIVKEPSIDDEEENGSGMHR